MMNLKALRHFIYRLEMLDSLLGVMGVLFILCGALFVQFFYGEQPCPLCLLQRVAFVNIGLALLLNVKYGNRAWHWAMTILSACAGASVSLRQICLHVNDAIGFGSAILDLHMYSWCFLFFALIIIGSAVMLLIYPERNLN